MQGRRADAAEEDEVIDRRIDDIRIQTGSRSDVPTGRAPVRQCCQHVADGSRHSREPIWNTATATTQAMLS